MARNVRTQADAGRKAVVAFGAIDQPCETALGEFGAGIVDRALNHLVIAALDQHVSDRAAQHLAGRNRHQMGLALVPRGLDQGFVVEALRLGQHGSCDLDQIVERQRADGQRRRAIDRSQPIGKQRFGGGFDVVHQALEHIVEQGDLIVGELDGAADEEIGDPAQRFNTAGDGSVGQRGLQFVEQAFGSREGFQTHDSVLE